MLKGKKYHVILLTCLLTFALLAGGCQKNPKTSDNSPATDKSSKLSTINITYVKSPLNVPSIVEKQKGLFEKEFAKEGLQINYPEITSGAKQTEALAAGSVDICNAVGGTSCILAVSNGVDLKIISMYSRAPKAFMIITKSPNIKTIADLKGKKVAGPKGTVLHQMLLTALVKNNIKPEDVEHVAMEQPAAVAALINGSVDAVLAAGGSAEQAIKAGGRVLINGEGLVDGASVVAVSGKFLKEHPDFVKRFKQVHLASLQFIKDNPEEAYKMGAEQLGITVEEVKRMYSWYDFDPTIKPSDIQELKNTQDFLINTKMQTKTINIEDLIAEVK
ncbi:MAG: NrtA/SsuA/CpmA family ABC transporter substrate-binding protein [Syntrophomonas sp.]